MLLSIEGRWEIRAQYENKYVIVRRREAHI